MKINLGGGPGFKHEGWLNFDEFGENCYTFSECSTLPLPDNSVDLVYSSHTLEHLNDDAVARLLAEAHRVLKRGGTLLLKLPDFETILGAYRRKIESFFKGWGFDRHQFTLPNKGMRDNITTRAAFLFCGFWNKEYGHHFGKRTPRAPGAYCGCATMPESSLGFYLGVHESPHLIASAMRQYVIGHETDYTFNHQNAWSRGELLWLLTDRGFTVTDQQDESIVTRHTNVPGIREMWEISQYCEARKHGESKATSD